MKSVTYKWIKNRPAHLQLSSGANPQDRIDSIAAYLDTLNALTSGTRTHLEMGCASMAFELATLQRKLRREHLFEKYAVEFQSLCSRTFCGEKWVTNGTIKGYDPELLTDIQAFRYLAN